MRAARLLVGVALVALGCGGSDGGTTNPGPTVASVSLSPATIDTLFSIGETAQLNAVAKDATGATVAGATVTFQSSAQNVATVSATGGVTAVGNGTTTITATSASATATASVRVRQKLAKVVVTPGSTPVTLGRTVSLSAAGQDARGNAIAGLPAATFTSDNTNVARVDAGGVVTGVAIGTANVTASVASSADGTRSANAVVNVAAAPPAAVTVNMPAGSNTFSPTSTEVSVGGTVTWVNNSGTDHDVDFGNPATKITAFGSGQRSLTFASAGTFNYFCTLHAGMTGTVVVR